MKSFSKILLIIITLLIAGPLESWAQKFEITADKTTVSQNERFQVYLTFEGADAASLQSFRPPSFRGFKILSGPNQSSSVQFINGKVSASITYSYLLVSPNTGTITITTAAVKFKGTEYKTKPLTINVIKATSQPQQKSSDQTLTEEELKENVFIIAQADKRKAIKGEQVSVTYKLFTSLNISSPQISKLPTYQGFWAEELETDNNIRFEVEMYKGVRYRSAVLKKVALFPTKSGKLTVT
ncbi:MAG: BatD family protein, partial [Candidatus Pacebacteria bacterium]|nr:BatD family protein [Candidatus Paceibacterota bacterium]